MKNKMTILWYNDLPHELQQLAQTNWNNHGNGNRMVSNLRLAISQGFCWKYTPQGHKFWEKIASRLTQTKEDTKAMKYITKCIKYNPE